MKKYLFKFFKKEYLILYVIIIIGAYVRLQGVFTNSFAFTYDVGRDMLALSNIVHLHKIPLIGATTGLPGIFYGPWWYYMLTPFFIIFSGNPQGIALTMALVGIVSIILGYCLGKSLGGNFLGLNLAGLISVSPNLISLSSQIWNPNISPLFVILILMLLGKIYGKDKKGKLLIYLFLGLLLALSIDLEIVFGLLLLVGIIISTIVAVNKKITPKAIIAFILGGLIILAPRIVFELRHQFLMTKAFIAMFATGGNQHVSLSLSVFSNRFLVMFDQFSSTLAANNKILGVVILLFIISSLLIFYKDAEDKIKNFIKTVVIIILVFLFGTIVFSHDIWPHYLVGLPIFYVLLLGLSFYLWGKRWANFMIPAVILVLLLLINLNPLALIQSFTKPLWEGDAAVYRNQLAVIDYVYQEAAGKPFKYVVYTPPVYDYTYQYLFNWYGPKIYHYSPQAQANLAYFILEPDYQDPSRLRNWLTQRKADGKIIKSEKVKGGIIVQTRVH